MAATSATKFMVLAALVAIMLLMFTEVATAAVDNAEPEDEGYFKRSTTPLGEEDTMAPLYHEDPTATTPLGEEDIIDYLIINN
ncbi:hypothetical protein CFP56_042736 [Quercus suber]|uniref:Uncharacterized protein n=1 Tax=Quercus suber TaxID=58331 RepID=A0AAW0LHX0_QUESU